MQSMNMQKSYDKYYFSIDFGLLRSPYCKISYLLADIKIRVKI